MQISFDTGKGVGHLPYPPPHAFLEGRRREEKGGEECEVGIRCHGPMTFLAAHLFSRFHLTSVLHKYMYYC